MVIDESKPHSGLRDLAQVRGPHIAMTLAKIALLVVLMTGCSALAPGADVTFRARGPLATRPQHPMLLTMLGPRPRSVRTQPEGSTGFAADLSWSSIFEQAGGPPPLGVFRMDGEFGRASVRARHGLGPDTDIEIEIAALYASSGFLDQFVNDFHELFGFPDSGRSLAPVDDFRMSFTSGGGQRYRFAEDTLGFGDLPVFLTHRVRREDEDGPGVAVRVGVEFPTGDEADGFSNGGIDFGAGVLIERARGPWVFTGSFDVILPASPDGLKTVGIEYGEQYRLQVGCERNWTDRLSLLANLHLRSPITDDFAFEEIDREILDLGLGFAWDVSDDAILQASFHEDLVSATGADFGVFVGLLVGF
tara:strand:- start:2133 stop:3218 length:1086 start_codon:yes stop_codon:yes gene_type:complete